MRRSKATGEAAPVPTVKNDGDILCAAKSLGRAARVSERVGTDGCGVRTAHGAVPRLTRFPVSDSDNCVTRL